MLPIAMLTGILLHNYIGYVAFLSRYLIFIMLLITYCRVKASDFHIGGYIYTLLCAQIGGAVCAYLLLSPFNEILAQGAFICFFCPTATAAPVITGILGGSISRVATFSLFSHVSVAILAPFLLSWMAGESTPASEISFSDSAFTIAITVLPLILGPLAIAFLLQRFSPKTRDVIANHQGLSFYIWAFALIIVVGNSVSFILHEPSDMVNCVHTAVFHRTQNRRTLRRYRLRVAEPRPKKHSACHMALINLSRPYYLRSPGGLCGVAQHIQRHSDIPA